MYWLGLQPGDTHLNISSPGWAKHAWSNVYAPWIAGATALVCDYRAVRRRSPARADGALRRHGLLRAADSLAAARSRKISAPYRRRCASAWPRVSRSTPRSSRRCGGPGASRSGTATARPRPPRRSATPPVSRSNPGRWAGRCPATRVELVVASTGEPADDGEICLDLSRRPLGLMAGYRTTRR